MIWDVGIGKWDMGLGDMGHEAARNQECGNSGISEMQKHHSGMHRDLGIAMGRRDLGTR